MDWQVGRIGWQQVWLGSATALGHNGGLDCRRTAADENKEASVLMDQRLKVTFPHAGVGGPR